MTPEEILRGAAEAIKVHGHATNNQYRNDQGCFCALGAMAFAAGKKLDDDWDTLGDVWLRREFNKAIDYLIEVIPGVTYSIDLVDWNDFRASKSEVIAKLRQAAASCEG